MRFRPKKVAPAPSRRLAGQATLEYMMILFTVVMAFVILKKTLGPHMRAAYLAITKKIESGIAPSDFHTFPLKK